MRLPSRQAHSEEQKKCNADRYPRGEHGAPAPRRGRPGLPPLLSGRGLCLSPLPGHGGSLFAPLSRGWHETAQRVSQWSRLRLALDASVQVGPLYLGSFTHLPTRRGVVVKMRARPCGHNASPTRCFTTLSARYRCDFTVFKFSCIASAISGNSSSSTKRSRKMLRCRSLSVSTVRHTFVTRSCAISRCSVELEASGSRSLISVASSIAARFQKRIFMLRWWSRTRFTAMRISQVLIAQSPRKLDRAVCARKKQSCVRDAATSSSDVANRM